MERVTSIPSMVPSYSLARLTVTVLLHVGLLAWICVFLYLIGVCGGVHISVFVNEE